MHGQHNFNEFLLLIRLQDVVNEPAAPVPSSPLSLLLLARTFLSCLRFFSLIFPFFCEILS